MDRRIQINGSSYWMLDTRSLSGGLDASSKHVTALASRLGHDDEATATIIG
jgi:hypothetical protein